MPPITSLSSALCLLLTIHTLPAATLQVDMDSAGNTQSGWQSLSATDSALGDSWSKNFTGGVSIDIDAIGSITLDHRNRTTNGGGSESDMWRDFLFASGSFSSLPGSGLSITITGLQANTDYPITIWAFDSGSTGGGRAADWSGGGAPATRLVFQSSPTPNSLSDNTITIAVTTDATGSVTIQGIVSATSPNNSHNVFINGLEIGDPTNNTGPADITISANSVARAATVGTTVGNLTTTDPTPGDTFTYTLASGAGSDNNGDFDISGNQLITDRVLTQYSGGTMLQVRIRTTDADEQFFEKAFLIEVINDSDNDGLDDTWEELYFTSITVATGTGNNDTDGLTNLQEQTHGTNPLVADTDADGINDDIEVNTYASNPLVKDTDGDGIDDGDEISSANGYITSPTLADTDMDGFSDALEIAEGTSPINNTDFPNTLLPLRINEILARNNTGLSDGFGNKEDWIEIYNPNNQAVNLDGYYLTDDAANLIKWNFPAVTIPASGYLIVFASTKDTIDPGGKAHTNFNLSATGEYLAIVRPNGTTIDDSLSFPEQFTDVSHGLNTGGTAYVFYGNETPGTANNTTPYPGVVKDTNFSVDRGFYDIAQSVAITSATPAATIRYTLDGSLPTPSSGVVYTGPISITTTSTIRAIAYFSNWLPTNVDTHTYIFVNDVVQQGTAPAGWPSDWGTHDGLNVNADYAMDPRVVNNTNGLGQHTVQEALLDIPTVAISMPIDDFISDATGIYANPQNRTEKICSMEYILPSGTKGFQEDCKIEVQGNASRRPLRMHKHSLRLTFTSDVGAGKLNYPLFPQTKIEEFNKLVLRACFTDSWALVTWGSNRYRPNDSMYMRDVWMKDSMAAMGNASGNGDFVHLYVNGLYFGLHDLTERIEDDWYAAHLGGETDDWEVNADISTPGPLWNNMISIVNGTITDNAVYEQAKAVIDIDNYCDYIFLHFYADAEDWPTKNGYAAANALSGDGKWRFQVWDQEISLDSHAWNRYNVDMGSLKPFQRLRQNAEFRLNFADRVAKHIYNGGALTEQNSVARYNTIASEIDKAIVAESARWGDTQATTPYANTAGTSNDPFADYYPPTVNSPIYFTREQHWLTELNHVTNTHIPIIHDDSDSRGIINELRANNLYPSIDPPAFAQHGGFINVGYGLHMTASDTVWFTNNGEDPRLVGGGINPNAQSYDPGITTTTLALVGDGGSSSLFSRIPTDNSLALTWTNSSFTKSGWQSAPTNALGAGYERNPPDSYTTQIDHDLRPTMLDTNSTVYLRYEFSVTDTSALTNLILQMKYDDGFIAYLNGVEVDSRLKPTTPTWNSTATGSHESLATSYDTTIALSTTLLQNGPNVLAIHGLNQSSGSSDFLIEPRLTAQTTTSNNASPVVLNGSQTIKARTLSSSGEWSALTEAFFIADDLVISEIMYRPATNGDAEYIELTNIGTQTINLEGVEFTAGITFAFGTQTLAPGEKILVVRNLAIFESVYGPGLNVAGEYTGGLSNDGEAIQLEAAGFAIRSFTYNDVAPWPEAADGDGRSIVLIAPDTNPDHTLPQNWRHSTTLGGNPGTSDSIPFTGNTSAELSTYAFGSSVPAIARPAPGSTAISITRMIGADDAEISIEYSDDLTTWTNLGAALPVTSNLVDGMSETLTYQVSDTLATSNARLFLRASATIR